MYESMCLVAREKQMSLEEKKTFLASCWRVEALDMPALVEFAMKMLGARWYSRAWCAHEVRVNEYSKLNFPLFLCFGASGCVRSFEFRFIHFIAVYLHRPDAKALRKDVWINSDRFETLDDISCPTLFQRMARICRLHPGGDDTQMSLLYQLTSISSFGCEKVIDVCAIALNSAKVPLVFTGNIQSRNDIHYISILVAVASGDIGPLLIVARTLKTLDATGRLFTSWAHQPYNGASQPRLGTPFPKSIHSATAEYIELDLLLIKARPINISPESLQTAYSILEEHGLLGKGQTIGVEDPVYTDPLVKMSIDLMKNSTLDSLWYQTILGCAMACGIDWIKRLPELLEKETRSAAWDHGTLSGFDSKYTGAAIDLLSSLGVKKENSPEFEEKFFHPAIRFFTCITDDRLRFLMVPRCLQTSASGDFALTQRVSNRSWIAVPQAVSHLPFFHNKAWIIEPYDPTTPAQDSLPSIPEPHAPLDPDAWVDSMPLLDSDHPDRRSPPNELATWQVRRRQPLFGCQTIVADGDAVILLKNQKVHGGEDYDWTAAVNRMLFSNLARRH